MISTAGVCLFEALAYGTSVLTPDWDRRRNSEWLQIKKRFALIFRLGSWEKAGQYNY